MVKSDLGVESHLEVIFEEERIAWNGHWYL
jgi:hypothetical protein